jgi:hypothetical protein
MKEAWRLHAARLANANEKQIASEVQLHCDRLGCRKNICDTNDTRRSPAIEAVTASIAPACYFSEKFFTYASMRGAIAADAM